MRIFVKQSLLHNYRKLFRSIENTTSLRTTTERVPGARKYSTSQSAEAENEVNRLRLANLLHFLHKSDDLYTVIYRVINPLIISPLVEDANIL